MRTLIKIILLSFISTIAFIGIIIVIGLLFIPEIGLHITYPIRLLRDTERYVGETRGAEVTYIWYRIILPFIFLTSAVVFFLLRKKLRL